jgi:hypothetical protein
VRAPRVEPARVPIVDSHYESLELIRRGRFDRDSWSVSNECCICEAAVGMQVGERS